VLHAPSPCAGDQAGSWHAQATRQAPGRGTGSLLDGLSQGRADTTDALAQQPKQPQQQQQQQQQLEQNSQAQQQPLESEQEEIYQQQQQQQQQGVELRTSSPIGKAIRQGLPVWQEKLALNI